MIKNLNFLTRSLIVALSFASPQVTYAMEQEVDDQPMNNRSALRSSTPPQMEHQSVVPTRTHDNAWLRTYFAIVLECDTPIWEALVHSNNYKYDQFKNTHTLTHHHPETLGDSVVMRPSVVQICDDLKFDLSDRTIFSEEIFDNLIMSVGSYFEDFIPNTRMVEVLLTPVTDPTSHEITEIRIGMMVPSIDEEDTLQDPSVDSAGDARLSKARSTRTYTYLYPVPFTKRGRPLAGYAATIFSSSYDELYMKVSDILSCFRVRKPLSTDLNEKP